MSHDDTTTLKGPSLARSPTLIIGALLAAWGLVLFLKAGDTPTSSFPDGTQSGPTFLGFEVNGWTAWFTTAAGALLLFGAAQHLMARTFALVVGLALGACSVIALWDGDDVLGLAAANGPDKLLWGAAAAALLVVAGLPRLRGHERTERAPAERRPVAPPPRRDAVPTTTIRPSPEPALRETVTPRADEGRVDSDRELRDGDRVAGAQADGARADGAHADGARAGGVPVDGARADGARASGVPVDGATADGARASGVPVDGEPSTYAGAERELRPGQRLGGSVERER